jgi:hypothetical protein
LLLSLVEVAMLARGWRSRILAMVLYSVYWLGTLAVVALTWTDGIPGVVVLLVLTNPLIAGGLIGRWLSSMPETSSGAVGVGALAGALWAEVTLFVMKGGVIDELLGWRSGQSYVGELLGFVIVTAVAGFFLGFVGAAVAAGFSEFDTKRPPVA